MGRTRREKPLDLFGRHCAPNRLWSRVERGQPIQGGLVQVTMSFAPVAESGQGFLIVHNGFACPSLALKFSQSLYLSCGLGINRTFGVILLGVSYASNQKRIKQRMEYRTDEEIIARGRQIAPLADDDLPPLITLATGVREYCDLMESLMPELGGEIDVTKMSRNMDGDA